jgi:hypothetical protein
MSFSFPARAVSRVQQGPWLAPINYGDAVRHESRDRNTTFTMDRESSRCGGRIAPVAGA